MNETFITEIKIKQSRNIRNLNIHLSDEERKHLIITGKNGSGKTSLLKDLFKFLQQVDNGTFRYFKNYLTTVNSLNKQISELTSQPQTESIINHKKQFENNINDHLNWLKNFGELEILFSNSDTVWKDAMEGDYLIAFFDAKRYTKLKVPSGITKINLKKKYTITDTASQDFIQYIVNLKADRSFARDDKDNDTVQKIDEWFDQLERRLRKLFDCPTLKLMFDRKNYNFESIENSKLPFSFNTLADGYSAILSIATELLLRMEGHGTKAYDLFGVVLIDEIETHLHVD
jgi:AAA15 family ATPase/GTPase